MDFRDTAGTAAFRESVRAFIEEERGSLPTANDVDQEGHYHAPPSERLVSWRKKLASRSWVAPGWPKEYGGAGLGVIEQFVLNEELAEAEIPVVGGSGIAMLGPTLIMHGTEDQRKRLLPPTLNFDIRWCQGYSEPGAGSDLAGLTTRATRDGDDYVINGQKIWTSGADHADWIFMLARTDPNAPKHRGISYLMVDMTTPGITVRPLLNMGGVHNFNEVYFEDVRASAANRISEENRGWYVGTTTLDFERSSVGNAVGARKEVEMILGLLHQDPGSVKTGNLEHARTELTDRWIEAAVAKLFSTRVVTIQAAGRVPNYEASTAKLYLSELKQRIARSVVKLFGMYGQVIDGPPSAQVPRKLVSMSGMVGTPAQHYMFTTPATVGGGTSEVQRNIIATRGLGLPR